jgi:hypothetical protein
MMQITTFDESITSNKKTVRRDFLGELRFAKPFMLQSPFLLEQAQVFICFTRKNINNALS